MIKRVFVDFCYFLNTSIACQSGTGLISKRRKLRATQHNTTLSKLTKHLRFVSCPRYQSKLSKFTQLCDSKGKVPPEAQKPKTFRIAAFYAENFPAKVRGFTFGDTSKKCVILSRDIQKQ